MSLDPVLKARCEKCACTEPTHMDVSDYYALVGANIRLEAALQAALQDLADQAEHKALLHEAGRRDHNRLWVNSKGKKTL